jgi:hypothetical protein
MNPLGLVGIFTREDPCPEQASVHMGTPRNGPGGPAPRG